MYVHADKINRVFQVTFERSNWTFVCYFVGYQGNTTCTIVYELRDSVEQQNISKKQQVENSSHNNLVTVTLPEEGLQTGSDILYFVVLGKTDNFTVAIEDIYRLVTGIYTRTIRHYYKHTILIIATSAITIVTSF